MVLVAAVIVGYMFLLLGLAVASPGIGIHRHDLSH